jgi:hypothetical protein
MYGLIKANSPEPLADYTNAPTYHLLIFGLNL